MQPICGHVLLSSDVSTRANATDQHTNTLLILENEVLVSHYRGIGTTRTLGAGALGAGAPVKIVVTRRALIPRVVFSHQPKLLCKN